MADKKLLSIGHGYVASALAEHLRPESWCITGTTRSTERAEAIRSAGDDALLWPGDDLAAAFAQASHVLISVLPDDDGCPVRRALPPGMNPQWVGYLSTTGVYGDAGGAWVDEDTPVNPDSPRGAARAKAEADWLATGLPVHVFRLTGIYGPDRSAFERVQAPNARRIIKPGQVFCRIHVDDIVTALAASMRRPMPGAIWNMADNLPAPPQDVMTEAARLLGIAPPPEVPFELADMSPMARSFYSASKRVDGSRIRADLGIALRHPDYRAGLRAILDDKA